MRYVLFLFVLAPAARSQPAAIRPATQLEIGSANLPAQSIGPNDLIAVQVYDAPELSRTVRVGADGNMRLPMLKRPVKVEGLLPADVERTLSKILVEEGILVEPFVTVTMVEYHSRPISVAGSVRRPLVFQATAPVTLLEAISKAEGLREDAGSDILVSRSQPGADGSQAVLTRRIPVRGLLDASDPSLNIVLTGGEEIRVPETQKIYVMGNVKKPGSFPVQDGGQTSVMQMLALAEGLLPFAYKEAFIYRREGKGNKNEIPIPLDKIMARKSPDVPLLANDILYIPDNKGRRLGVAALERVLMFGTTAGATALIYGGR
jgi:polysaccharide export outer membrane protein